MNMSNKSLSAVIREKFLTGTPTALVRRNVSRQRANPGGHFSRNFSRTVKNT